MSSPEELSFRGGRLICFIPRYPSPVSTQPTQCDIVPFEERIQEAWNDAPSLTGTLRVYQGRRIVDQMGDVAWWKNSFRLHVHSCLVASNKNWNGTSYLSHPEAHPELKRLPDPSEISIRKSFRKPDIVIQKKIISKNIFEMTRIFQLFIRNDILLIRDR